MAKNQRDFFKKKNEWSEIKDTLLRCYLPQYFQKLLVSGKPIFYIDCFAGKGKFDDGNDGSPLIAMQIINERLGMSRISRKNNAIVPCFIELNHAADLEQNLMLHPYQYGTPQVVDGKFEDNIRGLLKNKRGYNVFLYIDPYGIQALDSQLFDEIGTYGFRSFEMLINFNSFGFFRDACRVMKVDISQDDALMGLDDLVEYEPTTVTASPQSENLLTRIAGGNYWMDIVRDFQMGRIDGYQAERRLSAEYKQHLKQKYKYVLDMPIRLKPGQRPKYRMIHVCDHEDGCFLMADGFKANAAFFKLGFLDKNAVALGRQFKELLPVLWLKAGAHGPCPSLEEAAEMPAMLVLPENHFAVLTNESQYETFATQVNIEDAITTVYIVTDSEPGYREMISGLHAEDTYQLYRDYLDNFRINHGGR